MNGVIVRVQKQVVAGFKYIITFEGINGGNCDVTLWDKLDGSVEVLDDLCSARPMARSIIPGGWMTQDHTSQEYLDMLTEVYFASNSALHPDDLKLVKVESQVAGGINYKFTFKVGGSDVTCEVVIQHRAWLGEKKLLSETCQSVAIPMCGPGMWGPEWEREWDRLNGIKLETPICDPEGLGDPDWIPYMPGGFKDLDVNDPYVASLLVKSGMGAQNGVIVRVQKQVVAGFKYIITFEGINGGNCDVTLWDKLDGSVEVLDDLCSARPMKRAAVPICGPGMWGPEWEREWDRLNSIGIETPICDPEGLDPDCPWCYLNKRSMPGGFVDQDPTDEYFTDMLAEVYFSQNDALQEEDLQLVTVQSQVAGGINYKFTFKVAGSEVLCSILINDRPWREERTIVNNTCADVAVPMF